MPHPKGGQNIPILNYQEAIKVIKRLSESQRNVLNHILINQDSGHNLRTVESLLKMGLVVPLEEVLPGKIPVKILRCGYTIPVHMAWCQVCSDEINGELNV